MKSETIFKFVIIALIVAIMNILLINASEASGDGIPKPTKTPEPSHKVDICHNTASESNPFVLLNVDNDAVNGSGPGDHNRDGHREGKDIIPPFYDDGRPGYWTSRNWDTEGQAIFRNDCRVPEEPTPEPTPTETEEPSTPTETEEPPTPTKTKEPEVTEEPTFEPTWTPGPEITPTATEKPCKAKRIGMLFTMVSADGEIGYLASYQINPNTGTWAIPNIEAQEKCLGWIAVNVPNGDVIEVSCDGTINIVCRRCMGGGDDIPGVYND